MPYNVGGPGTCRVDFTANYMHCPDPGTGDGTKPPEQFIPIRPDGTSDPIQPGEPMYWKSVSSDHTRCLTPWQCRLDVICQPC